MKKITFILLFVAIGFSAMAQLSYGPKIGLNFAKYSYNYKDSDDENDDKMRLAPLFGVAVNYQFTNELALQSGLFFSGKGTAWDMEEIEGYWRYSTGYLEIPVNLAYGIDVGTGQLQFFAGPYLAYGITGKMKINLTGEENGEIETLKKEYKIKFKNKTDEGDIEEDTFYQTALDFGFGFGVGFKTGPILINVGYELGLTNLTPKWDGAADNYGYDRDDCKYSNRVINVSVSYLFGGK